MSKKTQRILDRHNQDQNVQKFQNHIDCACVIHGNHLYSWDYVQKLYNMLQRNFTPEIRFHVFTEHDRPVPANMIKHILTEWPGVVGPKKSWWYKIQMFDHQHLQQRLLYFDLDVVITGNLDWMLDLDPQFFWTLRDFKSLWRPNWQGINSSIMFWDTLRFKHIWQQFQQQNLAYLMRKFHGDQDFLTSILSQDDLRFVPDQRVASWRWQIQDGGLDFKTRNYRTPGIASPILDHTDILVFHGRPKPHEVGDSIVGEHWC